MFEPFLNQVSVSGGFPAHLQLRVTSESTSTVFGCGSTSRIGPTGDRDWKRERETESNNAVGLKGEKLLGEKDTTTVCFIPLTLDRSEWSGPQLIEHSEMTTVWLTVNVHQDADVGFSHSIENKTWNRLGEEGVVGLGGEHAFPGTLQHHTALSPSRI